MRYVSLIAFFILSQKLSLGQKCICDSICFCEVLTKTLKHNWNERIKNIDKVKLISIKEIGSIKTEANKKKYIDLLTADTAWIAYPVLGRRVIVNFLRQNQLSGRAIPFHDSTGLPINERVGTYMKKKDAVDMYSKMVKLSDKYYEIRFLVNGKLIISPTICSRKENGCVDLWGGVVTNLIDIFH